MDAELDGTVGAILKVYADKAGVVITNADGDQPGVEMNLFRFVKSIGVKPVLCGNIKGLQDPYRNPTTQEGFAKKWGQNPAMVTSFADGTKISFEQAIVANATGMTIGQRGMYGPTAAFRYSVERGDGQISIGRAYYQDLVLLTMLSVPNLVRVFLFWEHMIIQNNNITLICINWERGHCTCFIHHITFVILKFH